MYVDFHTHFSPELAGTWLVKKHIDREEKIYLSRGVHPWDLTIDLAENLAKFQNVDNDIQSGKFFAIGETGFDRHFMKHIPIALQEVVFSWHVELAIKHELPLILHVVHAHDILLKHLKKNARLAAHPIVIHDFRSSRTDLRKYLHFNVFFSFGNSLFGSKSTTPELLSLIPNDRFLLETDNYTPLKIEEVYTRAREVKNISLESIKDNQVKLIERLFLGL